MTDDGDPRKTKLYGAIDPPTLVDLGGDDHDRCAGDRRAVRRYEIREVLGRGGMGEVLCVRDEQIGRNVAVKRLRVENPSEAVVARFLREARIQGRLEHPAVVPVHELWHRRRRPAVLRDEAARGRRRSPTCSEARGGDRARERFSRQRLLRAFADVCLAIEFAHTRGVVHRDLKPANIMLGDFGEVYVLDWGIARVAGEPRTMRAASFADIDTIDGERRPSPARSSARPATSRPSRSAATTDLDGRADVYALGCILFEILALAAAASARSGGARVRARRRRRAAARARARARHPARARCDLRARHRARAPTSGSPPRASSAMRVAALPRRQPRPRAAQASSRATSSRTARRRSASGDGPQQRRDAMRAAARALALDPTAREPADLVGALMLEPPTETPPEVDARARAARSRGAARPARGSACSPRSRICCSSRSCTGSGFARPGT